LADETQKAQLSQQQLEKLDAFDVPYGQPKIVAL